MPSTFLPPIPETRSGIPVCGDGDGFATGDTRLETPGPRSGDCGSGKAGYGARAAGAGLQGSVEGLLCIGVVSKGCPIPSQCASWPEGSTKLALTALSCCFVLEQTLSVPLCHSFQIHSDSWAVIHSYRKSPT